MSAFCPITPTTMKLEEDLRFTGASDDELVKTGEEICRAFDQAPVLIKTYSERNRILVVSAD